MTLLGNAIFISLWYIVAYILILFIVYIRHSFCTVLLCPNIALLHFAWVVDDAKCIVVTRVGVSVCVCVCLSMAACLHYCMDLDVTWGSGGGCPLVVHCWADLQSVHGLRCYGNARNAWQSPAVIRQAHHMHCTTHYACRRRLPSPAPTSTHLFIPSILRGGSSLI